jgi:Pyruvate/2-oxoacid:ferredoxin oxidoreductase delta subunit
LCESLPNRRAHATRTNNALVVNCNFYTELCLAFKSVECRSCYDPCENRAIEMRHRVGAVAIPVIDATRCNGCGACHAPCPVTAIEIKNLMEAAA